MSTLIELLGFVFIAAFSYFVWPPLALLVVGLLLVIWANVRVVRAQRAEKKEERTDLRQVA